MKKIFVAGLVLASTWGLAFGLQSNSALLSGTPHPFVVQSGDTCYGLASNSIGPACGGAQNIGYIGAPDAHHAWCSFSGSWQGSLQTGAAGVYICNSAAKHS